MNFILIRYINQLFDNIYLLFLVHVTFDLFIMLYKFPILQCLVSTVHYRALTKFTLILFLHFSELIEEDMKKRLFISVWNKIPGKE